MPTDTLVDVEMTVKLVNVRRSRAEEAYGYLVASLAQERLTTAIWDKAEIGPLQLIGDDQALPHGNARQIKEKPADKPVTGEVSVPSPRGTYEIGRAHV